MNNLNLSAIELVSTLRKAPQNGAPSSQNYNDSMREILSDLSALTLFLNNKIVPVLNALPETAAEGLQGSTLYASTDDSDNSLFFNTQTGEPLTMADVLTRLYSMYQQTATKMDEITAKVVALQSRLATTSQNDVARVIQGFSNALKTLDNTVLGINQQNSSNSVLIAKQRFIRVGSGEIPASGTATVAVTLDPPFQTDNYSVVLSVEDPSGKVVIDKWVKSDDGVNPAATPGTKLFVFLRNTDTINSQQATIHASAKED